MFPFFSALLHVLCYSGLPTRLLGDNHDAMGMVSLLFLFILSCWELAELTVAVSQHFPPDVGESEVTVSSDNFLPIFSLSFL